MTVKKLIELLQEMRPDAEVIYFYDSGPRGDIAVVADYGNRVLLFDSWEYDHLDPDDDL